MAIGSYIKEIGRGKDGARALTREQACDLFGQILDGAASDLEVGAFCLAMRIKGETNFEMAGFLDATHARVHAIPAANDKVPTVVIPSYNGARKLPALTPLLALLLAREGLAVAIHGVATESSRVFTSDVFAALGILARSSIETVNPGDVAFFPTSLLNNGLQRLLDVRRVVGLRNSAHSLVKLMNPVAGPSLLVSSYTHPEYAVSMAGVIALTGRTAMLLRGTEGEAVADLRRAPKMQTFLRGELQETAMHQPGSLQNLPHLPEAIDAKSTASYIESVLRGKLPTPEPIRVQVQSILRLASDHEHLGIA